MPVVSPSRRSRLRDFQAGISESEAQKALVRWWRDYAAVMHIPEDLLFHIPNEAKRSYCLANKLRAEGMRAGIPDLMLAYPVPPFHGLFIEMKRPIGGQITPKQKDALSMLSNMGYATKVCRGVNEAVDALKDYLDKKFLIPAHLAPYPIENSKLNE